MFGPGKENIVIWDFLLVFTSWGNNTNGVS